MVKLNARCRTCGTVFPSGFSVENSYSMTYVGCTSGPCPRCRGIGEVILNNVTFDVEDEKITIVSGGHHLTMADLAMAATTLKGFASGNRSRKATERAIVHIVPQLAPEIQGKGLSIEMLCAIISVIIAAISLWHDMAPSSEVTSQQMTELIQEVKNLKASGLPKDHSQETVHQKHGPKTNEKPEGNP